MKAFADDKCNLASSWDLPSDGWENTVGKEENADFQQFLLVLQYFHNGSSCLCNHQVVWERHLIVSPETEAASKLTVKKK